MFVLYPCFFPFHFTFLLSLWRINVINIALIRIILSYRKIEVKGQSGQNRLKAGTDKPKLKVRMQSVSDDVVRKRLLEKQPRFELAAI